VGMANQMGTDASTETSALRRYHHRVPEHALRDRFVGAPVVDGAGKQLRLGPHPPVVHPKRGEQRGTERHVAVAATLPLANVNQHASTVDVRDLEL